MTKDKMYDLALGVAAVVLIYAVMGTRKTASVNPATGGSVFGTWNPLNPNNGTPYDPANPAKFISLSDLMKGSINDFFTGNAGTQVPMLNDIKNQAISDYYGNTSSGNKARDNGSVVFLPGTYW